MIARMLLIGSFALAAIMIYAIVDVAITPKSRVRKIPKPVWFIVIVLFPLVGALLWFLTGKTRRNATPPPPPADVVDRGTTTGPFSTESVDDRIARLEEELKRLDDEGDVPPKDTA